MNSSRSLLILSAFVIVTLHAALSGHDSASVPTAVRDSEAGNDSLSAEDAVPDTYYETLPLPLHLEKNVIYNATGLSNFLHKVIRTDPSTPRKVTIVHIGDSHIQAGFFSAPARKWLQRRFGNAGRGMIFPYRLIKTNGPDDYRFTGDCNDCKWIKNSLNQGKKPLFDTLMPGISGYVAESDDRNARLSITIDDPGYAFTHVEVFSSIPPDEAFCISVPSIPNAVFRRTAAPAIPWLHDFSIGLPANEAVLALCLPFGTATRFRIEGIVVTNDRPGILYHTIGVNGAKVCDYLHAGLFWEQLAFLRPDLLIVSLGVNEAFESGFNAESFIRTMDSLRMKVSGIAPECDLLLTTPNDHAVRKAVAAAGTVKTKSGRQVRKRYTKTIYSPSARISVCHASLARYCDENAIPYWDLFDVMGGNGSVSAWVKHDFAARDHLHFSQAGYKILGGLFQKALERSLPAPSR